MRPRRSTPPVQRRERQWSARPTTAVDTTQNGWSIENHRWTLTVIPATAASATAKRIARLATADRER
jgi:hypothetical protein